MDNKIRIRAKTPTFKIIPSLHFVKQLVLRELELSVLIPAYMYVRERLEFLERGVEMEMDIGRTTLVYSVDENNSIRLITGWVGNRQKTSKENNGKSKNYRAN